MLVRCHIFRYLLLMSPTTRNILKTLTTNWIHIVGFYFATYLTIVIGSIFDPTEGWEPIILTGFVAALLLFFVYGYVIVGWFYLVIVGMYIVAFSWKNKRTRQTLIIEWIIISAPFIYWAFEFQYWLWIVLSISLLITQMLRLKRIKKIRSLKLLTAD